MAEPSGQTGRLQECLDRLRAGDGAAREELLRHSCDQLTRLTRKMLRDYPGVHRWEQTDDVRQNAQVRLWRALQEVTPRSLAEFFRLAALQVRRELIDLARQYFGPEGCGAHHASHGPHSDAANTPPHLDPGDVTHEPARLAAWTEFHRQVEALPEVDREVFDLLWYQELTQAEAATVLAISERTLRRRWRVARVKVYAALKGGPLVPGAPGNKGDADDV